MQCDVDMEARMSEEELNKSMRAEWAKTRACMSQWNEELLLVQEEMRRVLAYHKWKASWWHTRSALRTGDASILSGISGYANKQAAISEHIGNQCASYWLPRLQSKGVTLSCRGWLTTHIL